MWAESCRGALGLCHGGGCIGGGGGGGASIGMVIGGNPGITTTVEPSPGRPGAGSGGEPGGGGGGGGGSGATPLLTSRVTMMPGIVCPPGVVPTTVPAEAVLLSELT